MDNGNCSRYKRDECNDQRLGGKHAVQLPVDGNERQRFCRIDDERNHQSSGTDGTGRFDEYGTDG